jgi:hypothetical protein
VVIVTYSSFPLTRLDETAIRAYAETNAAIKREVRLRQRNAAEKSDRGRELSEREEAILKEGLGAWVAEMVELPENRRFDPGITWEQIQCDCLVIDEGQNGRNLYKPEPREGGVPKFMGGSGEGSDRAWQWDFRCASVRRRTGGGGVVLLSGTPVVNGPLELFSLTQLIRGDAWQSVGIRDPEAWVDRFCKLEIRDVVGLNLELEERSACVGFQNLDDLRAVLGRYWEFRTADEVGLKLPEPKVEFLELPMNERQEAKYARYVADIERAMESDDPKAKGEILGRLARMALVAVHPDLDEGYTWDNAREVSDPASPKFNRLAEEVLKQTTCGHIVFCDNTAAHVWIREVLVRAGIPSDRIAVLNAKAAPSPADRQRISDEFNGVPEEGIAPRYDVVIANAVAYEGVNLQKRTCAIHHIDLPWEPSTLTQRNGRAVRQGNTEAIVRIVYYFAIRSSDGMRYDMIAKKRGWMVTLLKSQDRAINNMAAEMDLSMEDILVLISRDKEKTQARIAAQRAKKEAEERARRANEASTTLRQAARRYEDARTERDPVKAEALRSEARQRLEQLEREDPAVWPWYSWAVHARDAAMLVPPEGRAPVYEGLRVRVPSFADSKVFNFYEFGRVREKTVSVRALGSVTWEEKGLPELDRLGLRPEHATDAWPQDEDDARVAEAMVDILDRLRSPASVKGIWEELAWTEATQSFLDRAWARYGAEMTARMRDTGWRATDIKVPMRAGNTVAVGAHKPGTAIPPTVEGWDTFLRLAPQSEAKFGELDDAAMFWWSRHIPRTLLSAAREAA